MVVNTVIIQVLDDLREVLFGFFVQIGYGDAGSKDCVIGVLRREVCCSLRG